MSKVETLFVDFKAEIALVYVTKCSNWMTGNVFCWFQEFHKSVKQFGSRSGTTFLCQLVCKGYQQTTLVMPIGSTLFASISQYMQQTTGADYIFRSIFLACALRDSETWTKLKWFDIFTRLLKISIRQTGVHVTQRRCTTWNKLLLYSWPWSRASKIFDARRLIEVDVCEGKEVTKYL